MQFVCSIFNTVKASHAKQHAPHIVRVSNILRHDLGVATVGLFKHLH
jgi:hypothetical protein